MKNVSVTKIKRVRKHSKISRNRKSSLPSRATSIIHTSVRSSRITPASSHRDEISRQRFKQPTIQRISTGKQRERSVKSTNENNNHQSQLSTTILTDKESCGTVNDLFDITHRDQKKKKTLVSRRVIAIVASLIIIGIIIMIICIVVFNQSQTKTIDRSRIAILRWNTTGVTLFGTSGIRGNTSTQLFNPFGLILNSNNDFYIADRRNNRIQKCRTGTSICTTIAGQGNTVSGTNMSDLSGPTYMYMDSNHGLYIADSANHRIQYWHSGASFGTTIAGIANIPGSSLTHLNTPYGITLNSNRIYVADCNNDRVLQYTSGISTGTVLVGGNGRGLNNTQLNCPAGLHFDSLTNSLTIANFFANNIIRWKLGENHWTIVAGNANGLNGNTSTLLDRPTSSTYDPMGNIYIADMFNHRIQMFPIGQTNGTTIAGISGVFGNSSTMLYYPVELALDNQLHLYVTDSSNQRIQKFFRY